MSRPARKRPPRLDPERPREPDPPAPPTPAQLLRRARVAGALRSPGPAELRRLVERIAAGDMAAMCGLAPFPECTVEEVRGVLASVWGACPERPETDPELTLDAARRAGERLAALSAQGARIAFATAYPASLLPFHLHVARLVRGVGAEVPEEPDSPPFLCDGRSGRVLRRVGGVAVVVAGGSVLATSDPAASEELLFGSRRPRLLVCDGPFAAGAVRAGVPTVALAGVHALALGVAGSRGAPLDLIPLDPTRPPGAYEPLLEALESAFAAAVRAGQVTPGAPEASQPT